ncbi:MAG TPA: ferrochelatase [Candidatus Polarisedimenticolia bacterium]|nr:ferrochelatase [Candidatus Polarisedimenticolia bacterium]
MIATVLLMAYGSPDAPEQMAEFLRGVFRGRSVPEATVAEFQARYRLFGGRSPLLDISRRQAAQLQLRVGCHVLVGMRHWHPFIEDVVANVRGPILGLPLAPHYSRFSVGEYHEALRAATDEPLHLVDSWHLEPGLLDAWAERIRDGCRRHRPDVVLFTAHSVPDDPDDPYARQLQETVGGIMARLDKVSWQFAYQSASSAPLKWLGPDVDARLRELRRAGAESVLAAPVSFVSDHAEVLYDLDHLHRRSAEALGIRLERCESLNEHPRLIEALADVVRRFL